MRGGKGTAGVETHHAEGEIAPTRVVLLATTQILCATRNVGEEHLAAERSHPHRAPLGGRPAVRRFGIRARRSHGRGSQNTGNSTNDRFHDEGDHEQLSQRQ
jgi:hypothetical protein